jgi:IclR family transcriptional regulator, pca regulon regulatory protein
MDRDDQGKESSAREARERQGRIKADADPRMSRSMEYGLAILQCFSSERPSLGIADIAGLLAISRSTTHRYVTTLTALGYLEQGGRRKYRLAPRAAEPGMAAIGALRLSRPARAVLEELRDQTGNTVSVGLLDDQHRVLYVDRVLGHCSGQVEIDEGLGVGVGVPVHCTALGKALLAGLPASEREQALSELTLTRHGPGSITQKRKLAIELDRVREEGLALSDQELKSGMRSIAALIVDPRLSRPLAIDLAAPSSARSAAELVATVGPLLKQAGQRVATA